MIVPGLFLHVHHKLHATRGPWWLRCPRWRDPSSRPLQRRLPRLEERPAGSHPSPFPVGHTAYHLSLRIFLFSLQRRGQKPRVLPGQSTALCGARDMRQRRCLLLLGAEFELGPLLFPLSRPCSAGPCCLGSRGGVALPGPRVPVWWPTTSFFPGFCQTEWRPDKRPDATLGAFWGSFKS